MLDDDLVDIISNYSKEDITKLIEGLEKAIDLKEAVCQKMNK